MSGGRHEQNSTDNSTGNSDNFSFQNNGIKECTCRKTMGFWGKQCFFKKAMFLHDFTNDLF